MALLDTSLPQAWRTFPAAGQKLVTAVSVLALLEPLVGMVFQAGYARAVGAPLQLHQSLLLGLSLWLVYIGDRWLDGLRYAHRAQANRHRFAVQHRRALLLAWCCGLGITLTLALVYLQAWEWQRLAFLLLATSLYFAWVHWSQRGGGKELLVTLIYTGGVLIFHAPALQHWTLPEWALALTFCAVVFQNLATIACAERQVDELQGCRSLALRFAPLQRLTPWCGVALVLVCTWGLFAFVPYRAWFAAVGCSAALLWALGQLHTKLQPQSLHVLADLALLVGALSFWV